MQSLEGKIAKVPRVVLGHYPTPITEARSLSRLLGGPRILIKRDDLSGLALGGNKCRQIEFLMGYIKSNGYDVVLYGRSHERGNQSNYAVQLLAASKKADMEVKIYMRGVRPEIQQISGNMLLQDLMTPDLVWTNGDQALSQQDKFAAWVLSDAKRLENEGRRPYVMQTIYGNPAPIEQIGWVNAAIEIHNQLQDMGVKAHHLIVANSQGGTQSGLIVGAKCLGETFQVIGISVMYRRERQVPELIRMTNETARYLELGVNCSAEDVVLYDDYLGGTYGALSPECVEAIKLVAQAEGIFLDPTYTGKAMAGLISLIQRGKIKSNETVVFVHTGGISDLFQKGGELLGSC